MWSTKVKKWGGFGARGGPSEKYSAGAGVAVEFPSVYGGDEADSASCKRQALGLARLDDGSGERATFVEEGEPGWLGDLASRVWRHWGAGCDNEREKDESPKPRR